MYRSKLTKQRGVTLIETMVFLVVVGIALGALLRVYQQAVMDSVDPVVRIRALEIAQAQLDEIIARKFDETTPVGGVPPCNGIGGDPCTGITADTDYDDVGDYNGYSDTSDANFLVNVQVNEAGSDLGVANANARLISVTVDYLDSNPLRASGRGSLTLSVYRVNF